jgi:hypothetical protein
MRIKLFAILLVVLVSSFTLFSQETSKNSKEGEGGIGVQIGGSSSIGGHAFYNLAEDMRLGLHFGFVFDGGHGVESSTTALLFAPYFEYYFTKIKSFKPFVGAEFSINSGTYNAYNPELAKYTTTSLTSTDVNIIVGGEWEATKTVSLYGGFTFFNMALDPMRIKVGLGGVFMGINWYMF